jgi:S-adenosylmethionine:tRNA ribosyltransferase-isomerase
MHRSDFHYELPSERIAQRPLTDRGASRLLSLDGPTGAIEDLTFRALPRLLRAGDLIVFNDTRVMRARLLGRKPTGGRVEILIERLLTPDTALAHCRPGRSLRLPIEIAVDGGGVVSITGRDGALFHLSAADGGLPELMARCGHMPLPPYIARPDDDADAERYQTVYASREGAIAAPTAGLHFDEAMLARLTEIGVRRATVTLHVGAGTFQPVRVEQIDTHEMHAEWLEVDESVCRQVAATRAAGGRVVAVGTTTVRSLETAAQGGALRPFCGDSRLFIRPGYRFCAVDAMVTNFHLPESTLLMLISAFAGHQQVMAAYRHAVEERYRFFSYGDAMFLTRRK